MRLTEISIENMAGFQQYAVPLFKSVTVVEGKNGEGKTGLLDCFRYALGRGHDPDMIHGTAPGGSILLTFDDGSQVKCRATRKGTDRGWKPAGGTKFTLNRTQIDAIANQLSYDPLALLDLDDKRLVEEVLKIVDIPVEPQEILDAIGDSGIPTYNGMNALECINASYNSGYQRRHDVNVLRQAAAKTASELAESVQPDDGMDWSAEADRKRTEKESLQAAERAALADVNRRFAGWKTSIQNTYREWEAKRRQEAQDQIRAIETALAADIQRESAAVNNSIEEQAVVSQAEYNRTQAERHDALQELDTAIATAAERARNAAGAAALRNQHQKALAEAGDKNLQWQKLDAALKRLTDLKIKTSQKLPIPGITITDGRIVDSEGLPLSRWNEARQVAFVMRIGVLTRGEAGFLIIDNCERFDSEGWERIKVRCKEYADAEGLQFIVARVADVPLRVTSGGETR